MHNPIIRLFSLTSMLFCAACTFTVPVGKSLQNPDICDGQCVRKMLVVADQETHQSVTHYRPIDVTSQYSFKLHEATANLLIDSLLAHRFDAKLKIVDELDLSSVDIADYAITFSIIDHKIGIGPTVFNEYSAEATIGYRVYNPQGELVLEVEEHGTSNTAMTSGELARHILIPYEGVFQQTEVTAVMARTWDSAVLAATQKFIRRLKPLLSSS